MDLRSKRLPNATSTYLRTQGISSRPFDVAAFDPLERVLIFYGDLVPWPQGSVPSWKFP